MRNSKKLADLLLHWEELRGQGEAPTAEALCEDSPELVGELKRRMRIVAQMEALLCVESNDGERRSSVGAPVPQVPQGTMDHQPAIPGYQIIDILGQGGMGVVYRARHNELNRSVALKMIKTGELASEQEVKRFRAEAESAANLQHPNIVSIYEVGELEGQHY